MTWLAAKAEENETRSAAVRDAETAFGEHYPVLKHQPLTRQVTHILSRLQRFRELMMENDKLKIDLAQVRRENETLARQVPPLPQAPRDHPSVRDCMEARKASDGTFPFGMGDTTPTPEFMFKSLGTDGGRVENTEPVIRPTLGITRILGQAWCRTEVPHEQCLEIVRARSTSFRVVLCNVHQDVTTGELTYEPISFDDLPRVTESPAS